MVEVDELGHPIEDEQEEVQELVIQPHQPRLSVGEEKGDEHEEEEDDSMISEIDINDKFANDSEMGDKCEELLEAVRKQESQRRKEERLKKLQNKQRKAENELSEDEIKKKRYRLQL